jgi:hypothetical protein
MPPHHQQLTHHQRNINKANFRHYVTRTRNGYKLDRRLKIKLYQHINVPYLG